MSKEINGIIIHGIFLEKPDGSVLDILPIEEGSPRDILTGLIITESLTRTAVTGTLTIKEYGAAGDYYNLQGNETITIDIENPGIDNSRQTLKLCVSGITFIGDETTKEIVMGAVKAGIGWDIEFMSCENYLLNWVELDYMDEDFIGKIGAKDANLTSSIGGNLVSSSSVSSGGSNDEGLVNVLAEKYFNPGSTEYSHAQNDMEIETTANYVWLKKNQNMYPWGKDTHQPNLIHLMNNLAENAVTVDEMGVNYMFWADFDGYHFKSIRKMIADTSPVKFRELGGNRTYRFSDDPIDGLEESDYGNPVIHSHKITNEYDHLSMWHRGAYSSYYELIKPNYSDPYFDYLDFTTQHQQNDAEWWGQRELIDYDYHRDAEKWGEIRDGGRIEEYKLIPDNIDTSINMKEPMNVDRKSRRKYDDSELFGYYDAPYNNYNELSYDFLGSYATDGKQGKRNDISWQTMFDQTDLEGEILKKIQKEIKEPIRNKMNDHVHLLNLKEKFNVYRHSICCDKTDNKYTFLAILTEAQKITDNPRGGIYEYSWKEIEVWPKDFIDEVDGEVIDDVDGESPLSIVEVGGGMTGGIQTDEDEKYSHPAYNINELLNKTEDAGDVFVGPGVNAADDEYNDYPEAYQMMPVGGYFKIDPATGISVDPCELQDDDGNGIEDGPVEFRGHIVQMYRIPNHVLEAVVPVENDDYEEEPDRTIPENIYFFDVPNAHDGLCGCL